MATVTDVEVANQSFPNVRQDLNDILEALATNFSADAEPTTTYPNQFWYETDTNLLYIRNEANDAWVTLASINQTSGEWEPRTAVIQAVDSAGLAFKTDEGTTRLSISDAGQVSFQNYSFPTADGSANQVLTTDGAGTLSFADAGGGADKIEEGNSSVEVVDTGTGYVAITTDGTENARFTPSGFVIGATSAKATFDVLGKSLIESSNASGKLYICRTDSSVLSGDVLGELHFTDTDQSNSSPVDETHSPAFIRAVTTEAHSASNRGAYISFLTKPNGTSDSSFATERMRIDQDGDLMFNSGFGSVATAYGCRAWVNFNGTGTVAIREDGNVSSITDNGAGDYTINFSTALPDSNYSVTTCGTMRGSGSSELGYLQIRSSSGGDPTTPDVMSTTAIRLFNKPDDTTTSWDLPVACVAVFR